MKVGIIGTGLQFRRRAPVIAAWPNTSIAAVATLHYDHAQQAAAPYGAVPCRTWEEVVARDDLDVVVVCTPPHVHAAISIAALQNGKHVLCEKPLTRTIKEAEDMVRAANETGKILKCGFNHRHHPAIGEAWQLMSEGAIGNPLFARCRYGICGRPGYEKEWRADPEQAAGGQFIEQGTHAMDLFRWFLGDLAEVGAMTSTAYFKEQELDDGGMAIFRAASGATASLHTTLTEWQNRFSFEVFGEDGYVRIRGLGSSYGNEELIIGKRDFEAPFQDAITHYRGGDVSWKREWDEFMTAIDEGRQPLGNGVDGLAAMQIGLTAYRAEQEKRILPIPRPVV
ncbi:MAG: Gfo/Idh/MocA family oxidoreductase [Spartobacteria bacterium]|nr:Gfo/Idh/MocA family oxidoreductase [Spartobacteria bacterium]